ncbi:2-oxo-4-hydroxy-4-carboxy-5-ureidoimidazoline decarboxylase [Streptomyces sp. JJ38]|uniref:2-oxo-4-hydroxy-4-carboxy-5-ureidoimidazoline decarboxylase n=1 Tax=Streptomyces sp. JJ38 TaxID=2738128 RepID=UPI001C585EC4|nr:2-oxo-4-hydroxy-4-carboxy-5-ureidoimidazoline decarboxylase [Streptomyces sp. JJ38]MBW1596620.1 2-oxo-4-hydroxy-4-carboxy-5-ureidoimidazoline decarboxylase [Streptomyces sp. JJ38]
MRLPAQRGPRTPLDRLNVAPVETAVSILLGCYGSRRWAERMTEHRPYPNDDALLAAAEEASYDLRQTDVLEAWAAESAAQQPVSDGPGALVAHTALRAAQAAYESKFGHAFVICLDDLPPDERLNALLDGIRARLGNSPEEERGVAADELRALALARLRRVVSDPAAPRTPHSP